MAGGAMGQNLTGVINQMNAQNQGVGKAASEVGEVIAPQNNNVYTPPAAQQGVGMSPFAQQMAMRSMTQQPVMGLPSALLQRQQMQQRQSALTQNPITALYQNILGRAPDAEGAQYWQNQLNSGMPLSEIQQAFLNSQEYKSKAPTQQPQMQMPFYRSQALNYRPNMQQAQQNLRRVKPSVYKTDLDNARARIAELEAAEEARRMQEQNSYDYGGVS